MSFFCFRSMHRTPCQSSCLLRVCLFVCDVRFSELPCFRWSQWFEGVLVNYFVDCPSVAFAWCVFSWLGCSDGFWGRPQICRVILMITSDRGCVLPTWLTTADVALNHETEVVSLRFLLFKVLFSPSFPHCPLWKDITMCPHWRSGCHSPPPAGQYLNW